MYAASGFEELDSLEKELVSYLPNLRNWGSSLLRRQKGAYCRADVDDLVHDTIARALTKRDLFEEGTNLRSWLFTIMHSQSVNQVRRRGRRKEDSIEELTETSFLSQGPNVTERLIVRDTQKALNKISPLQKRVIILAALGMSYEEIARKELLPVGTVRSQMARGREILRDLVYGAELTREELEHVCAE